MPGAPPEMQQRITKCLNELSVVAHEMNSPDVELAQLGKDLLLLINALENMRQINSRSFYNILDYFEDKSVRSKATSEQLARMGAPIQLCRELIPPLPFELDSMLARCSSLLARVQETPYAHVLQESTVIIRAYADNIEYYLASFELFLIDLTWSTSESPPEQHAKHKDRAGQVYFKTSNAPVIAPGVNKVATNPAPTTKITTTKTTKTPLGPTNVSNVSKRRPQKPKTTIGVKRSKESIMNYFTPANKKPRTSDKENDN